MSGGLEDDFWEVSGLLFGAAGRYRSARATVVYTFDRAVAAEANRRLAKWWKSEQGSDPGGEEFYGGYENEAVEEVVRLWHERPGRWREESSAPGGEPLYCVVSAGPTGPWRYYERGEQAQEVPCVPAGEHPDMYFSFMLDPSEYYFRWVLTNDTTTHKTVRRAVVAGREVFEVRVGTISWGYLPRILPGFFASQEGTTDHPLLVDARIGTVLRVAARLDGEEFRVAEVTEISYDEDFPEGTFRLEIPGVKFRRQED